MPFRLMRRYPILTPVLIIVTGMLMFPTFTMFYTASYVSHQDQQWCRLLEDITAYPPPPVRKKPGPHANSQALIAWRAWNLYNDTRKLEDDYGCRQ